MRHALVVAAALAALGGCVVEPSHRVSAPPPPAVSYRLNGSDLAQADVSASQYCQRYGAAAVYRGMHAEPSGNVALYSCDGPAATSGSSVPPAAARGYPCADSLHQNRPGGTDYDGPPTYACPPMR